MTHGECGGHAFDPAKWQRLESAERREKMKPERLAEAMALQGNETVVDVGCGTGFFAEPIARQCARYVGVDHSPEMLTFFRDKHWLPSVGNVELKEAKADALPLEDGSSDIIFHVALMHEIPDIEAFHREVRRVLVPGGRLIIVDWEAKETEGGPPTEHRLPRERVLEVLARDGFDIVDQPDLYADFYVIVAAAAS